MDLSSLKVDELLCLVKYISPADGFALVASGVLKGFEKAFVADYVTYRFKGIGIRFRPHTHQMHQLEIRSLTVDNCFEEDDLLIHLVGELFLQNLRHLDISSCGWPGGSWMTAVICSMEHLRELLVHNTSLTLDDLGQVFQHCHGIIRLSMSAVSECQTCSGVQVERVGSWLDPIRTGFRRLQYLKVSGSSCLGSLKVITEILVWCGSCAELHLDNISSCPEWGCLECLDIDSQPDDGDYGKEMKSLTITRISPSSWLMWLLPLYQNLHRFQLQETSRLPDGFLDVMGNLKRLKELQLALREPTGLGKVIQRCQELKVVAIDLSEDVPLADFRDCLQVAANVEEFQLTWSKGPSAVQVLPLLKKWRRLRKLTLSHLGCCCVPQLMASFSPGRVQCGRRLDTSSKLDFIRTSRIPFRRSSSTLVNI